MVESEAPPVSVVIPVLNGMPYVRDAIDSILGQTFADFELVILDNGSTDGTTQLIRDVARADPRVKPFFVDHALGMVNSSNAVVEHARSPLVARMDADDVAHRDRLMRQVEIMSERPDAAVVGVLGNGIDPTGRRVRSRDRSRLLREIRYAPFPHGSIMFRREVFDIVGGYRAGTEGFEDQDLFRRMLQHGKVLVLEQPLHSYRFHLANFTTTELARHGKVGRRKIAAQRVWSGVPAARVTKADLVGSSLRVASQTFLLGTWGAFSPRTLRALMGATLFVRDVAAGVRLRMRGRRDPHEWRFPDEPSV